MTPFEMLAMEAPPGTEQNSAVMSFGLAISTFFAVIILILLFLPIAILIIRKRRFISIARLYKSAETERMARSSSVALRLYIILFALSYVPGLLFGNSLLTELSWFAIWTTGLLMAIAYDRAAERVKRQLGLTKEKIKALQSEGVAMPKQDETSAINRL